MHESIELLTAVVARTTYIALRHARTSPIHSLSAQRWARATVAGFECSMCKYGAQRGLRFGKDARRADR
jgi:hypothetical protein